MDNTSSDVMEQVGEGLYDFTAKGGVKPALATNKPKATDHGKKYVFNLRKDAKWSNGKPVTAKDFVYSWRRTVDPKTKSPQSYYFDGVKNYQRSEEHTSELKSPTRRSSDLTAKGGVKPALATNKPKATDHGKKYVFNLRKDAKWSNGKPVTAKDFVYSWRRTVDPKTKSPQSYYFDGVKNYQ